MPLPSVYNTVEYPLVKVKFFYPKLAQGQAATAMFSAGTDATSGTLAVQTESQPFGGWIVGFAVDLSTAVTAGTMTLTPTINGVAITAANYIKTFSGSGQRAIVPPALTTDGAPTFTSGQCLGCNIASNGSYTPNGTNDITVTMYVILNGAAV
jgi:hypothetical protein